MSLFTILRILVLFFPLVILLDYNKKEHINTVVVYLLCFYGILGFVVVFSIGMWMIPVVLLAILLLCLLRWQKRTKIE